MPLDKLKSYKKILASLLILPLLASTLAVTAQDLQSEYDTKQQELNEIQQKKQDLENKIAEAQYQERTLANQIAYFNNNIYLTELEISETQSQIITTQDHLLAIGGDIEKLGTKLANLDDSINELTRVIQARIRTSYELSHTSDSWAFLLSTNSLEEYVRRYTYITTLQREDQKLLRQMQSSQVLFNEQKDRLEELKQEKEGLKSQLEEQKEILNQQQVSLDRQRSDKQYLLAVTENEEARYQELLQAAKQDEAAIRSAISNLLQQIAGNVLTGTEVKCGGIIGLEGNTGAVYPRPTVDYPYAGTHLHFSVLTCGSWTCVTNPWTYLNNGTLQWPLTDFVITQEYGYTAFASTSGYYTDQFHNGIDIKSNAGYGAPVLAAADGTVYYTVDGWGGHGALVKHADNLYTAYWHLQPVKQ
ncbi:peptidoglycan DD-metalloendopeptidase family protein [Patescibacteria group bacterium]|nr:peptidoglycan DD-metalloendopeptidase family protein [Patescibacteria group bacterium]